MTVTITYTTIYEDTNIVDTIHTTRDTITYTCPEGSKIKTIIISNK